MSIKYTCLIPMLLSLGCSSTVIAPGEEDLDSGSDSEPVGQAGASGAVSGSGGASTGGSSSGGVGGGSAGSGGTNSGGTGGNTQDAGGSAGAGNTGSGGTGGEVCVPKNCLTIGIELANGDTEAESCGIVSDGCSGFIDCNDCTKPYQACGRAEPPVSAEVPVPEGTPNLCGGDCVLLDSQTCSVDPVFIHTYGCTAPGDVQPFQGKCIPSGNIQGQGEVWELPTAIWCCRV